MSVMQPVLAQRRVTRLELTLLLTVLGLALVARAWQLSTVGVDHFDEGVYVFSALGLADSSQPHRLYPGQFQFSPLIYPLLVSLAYRILGASDLAAIGVNVVLGALSVSALWGLARSWFGAAAGLAAATLLALNPYHIALSRSALTDVAFSLFFMLALVGVTYTFRKQSIGLAVLSGLLVGLAWSTKYHGWFVLVIAGLAQLPVLWQARKNPQLMLRRIGLLVIVGVVAALCQLPWALYVQSQPGGYLELLRYQRTLIDGRWLPNLLTYSQQQVFFEGPLARLSVVSAFLMALMVVRREIGQAIFRGHATRIWAIALVLAVGSLLLGEFGMVVLLTLIAILVLVRAGWSGRFGQGNTEPWLLISWLLVMFASTPLYHPYARLALPFLLATFVASGYTLAMLARLATQGARQEARAGLPAIWVPRVAALAMLAVLVVGFLRPTPSNPWRPARSVAEAATSMAELIPIGSRVIVVGEPDLAFYLHQTGRPAFERLDDPKSWHKLQSPVYLATGVYSQRAPSLRKGLEELSTRLVLLGTFSMKPKDIRLLDDFSPTLARQTHALPDGTHDLRLYYVLPMPSAP